MTTAAAILLSYGSGLTFFQDSWVFLLDRRDLSAEALFAPHNEHIVLIPVLIEQLLLRLFGMSSMMPELVVLVALLLGTAALVFVYVRRRLGPWPALFAAVMLLFLGPAWQDLLWPFQVGLVGSVLCGMGMLLALEGDGRRSDLLACVLLILSVGFSSLGLVFAVAAAVDVLQRRDRRGLRRGYLVAVPLLLYAGWYVGWGHGAESNITLHNVLVSPRYVGEGLVASLDSALALGTISGEVVGRSKWGLPLLIALLALVAWRRLRGRALPPGLWPVLAAAAAFWFLAAFNSSPGREPYSSRYLYVGALFVLLLAANLLQGVRLGRRGLFAMGILTAVIAGFNLVPLREGRDFFESQTVLTRADLAAIEIAAPTVDPGFTLAPEISGTLYLPGIEAGKYLRAVREHGSPAYTPAELASAPAAGRKHADLVLAHALPLDLETNVLASTRAGSGRCLRVAGRAAGGPAPVPVHPGVTTIEIPPGGPAAIRLRRFAADQYPLATEGLPGASTTRLEIPRDRLDRPWWLLVEAAQGGRVCRA